MNIILLYKPLPPDASAVVCDNFDGSYSILINSNKPEKQQIESILHELIHINNYDFDSDLTATMLEKLLHAQEHKASDYDLGEINFYAHYLD